MHNEGGYVLLTVYVFLSALLALLGVYFTVSEIELATTKHSKDSATGFYTAEAALNVRAKEIRDIFVGYNRPTGTTPSTSTPCENGDNGSGDFVCDALALNNRTAMHYVEEAAGNPLMLTIPPGELYQNLNAQEYRYTVRSMAKNIEQRPEAILELRFKSRLVPLFQFVAFYNKDLEILPGPTMNLSGPIHTNGDLYLNANNALNIAGQITTAGDLYRGRKNDSSCNSKPVTALDPANPLAILPSCASRTLVPNGDLTPWNGMVESGVDVVTVPEPDALHPTQGEIYWDKADLRLMLRLNGSHVPITDANSSTGIYVMNSDLSVNATETLALHGCTGSIGGLSVGASSSFYNNREGAFIKMAEIDIQALLNCLHTTNWLGEGLHLDDNSEGGLVFHFSVNGPSSSGVNNYGVRVRNASELQSSDGAAPDVIGMTVVSDQAFYTAGNYNSTNKIPAAILCDSINVLSNNWNLNDSTSTSSLNSRVASNTTINAAFLSGTDSTGGAEGAAGQGGGYNGGLENYPRFHESWSGRTLTYRGSFVSLNTPQHVDGAWVYGSPQYTAPGRNWDYDTDFNDASNLPPLSPRFVYLRQELFVRDFEQ
ncbi:MAG: hypothetical protein KDD55_01320 [Bdellovibrionales bacterium]|nr:hypothetical protein [Bdellovibrionales bacterium]